MSDQPQYPSYPGAGEPQGQSGQQPPPPGYGQQPPPPGYGQQPVHGQPPYGHPGYGHPAQPRSNGKALAAMIVGIVSIVFCYLGLLIGPVAIFLAVAGKKEIRQSNGTQTGDGMATAGLVTGIIGTVVWAAVIALIIIGTASGW